MRIAVAKVTPIRSFVCRNDNQKVDMLQRQKVACAGSMEPLEDLRIKFSKDNMNMSLVHSYSQKNNLNASSRKIHRHPYLFRFAII